MTARTKLEIHCNGCSSAVYEGPWRMDLDDSEHAAWKAGWTRLGLRDEDRHNCPKCAARASQVFHTPKPEKFKRNPPSSEGGEY